MTSILDDQNDPFTDLENRLTNRRPVQDVANANPGMNVFTKQGQTKTVQLKAENFELFNTNEKLTEENGTLGTGLNKLQNKHDKLMYLARNRLSEVRTKYQKLEQDNQYLREQLERLRKADESSKKSAEDYLSTEERYKTTERELRTMVEKLKRDNDDLKTKYSINELQTIKENYITTKQALENAKRDMFNMQDEIQKAQFDRDAHQREVANMNEKFNDMATLKRRSDQKLEVLTEQVEKLQTGLKRSEGNCQLLHERLTTVKKERDTIDTETRGKITILSQSVKDLTTQNKTLMEQFRAQSKQCEHLDSENKQLLEYVNGYRKENDILAKQIVTANSKQKQLVLEIEKFKSADASVKNEEALRMQNALMSLTDQLTQLRKLHANTLAENRQIKELLIEKDSSLTSLGYERHQLQDKVVKNEHTLRQMERKLAGHEAKIDKPPSNTEKKPAPLNTAIQYTTTPITNSFANVVIPS
ncbi:unnamed protein product [Adineta steineri]|uniref:Uncharacterized protein n=1 Tax=Adineta steineri TaxID=433720 RepID=A0A818X8T5_9BILA|nr:unnamed protein product [Adineta steineri]CAF3734209.1 unnamed protein product [Adineta steineri]